MLALKPDYVGIFSGAEETLFRTSALPASELTRQLEPFRSLEGRHFSDDDYWGKLVEVIFYSGFRAATVTRKLASIHRHFPGFEVVARYDPERVRRILADKHMIKNARKIQSCVSNAREFLNVVRQHGSFKAYVDSFAPRESPESLDGLKLDLRSRLKYLGDRTVLHFLMEVGMPVLKPDRVICRIFSRLGLINADNMLEDAVRQGREFARSTGHPIRYIDIVFVACGQEESPDLGIRHGICLEKRPACDACGLASYCTYHEEND